MVKTNIQTFTGEVEILSNLHVGNYLTANGDASNVLDVSGNVGATFFVGDGGLISNIATTLSDIVDQGNLVANVVQFNAPPAVYGGVGVITRSNVGIQNANPLNTLSIADKIVIDKDVSEPSTTMNVHGKVYASRFEGDGGLLSNIATTLEAIIDQGNVSANVVQFNSATDYAGAGIITRSNVGIQNTAPVFNLSVGSNLHVNDQGSNVLTIHGNVAASNLNLGVFTVSPSHGLDQVCAESNLVTRPVRFSNVITAISAVSNIESAGTFISTDAERGIDVASNIDIGGRLKFDSNVFIDTLRVADVASNIVTYDQTTGELTDSGGTLMNKFAIVSEQPPSDFFANTTTVTNHGTYTLTTSNLATNSNTFNAFDGTANAWVSGGLAGGYIGGANVFQENNFTQLSNIHPTKFGDWLAIEFPYKTTLRHMKLTPLTAEQFPENANLYATNNDITWSEIKYWEGIVPASDTAVQTITVDATEQFKKYALVATRSVDSSNVAIKDWQLFTESFSIDGGKVAMAQQAATGGETVMDQSGPHSRLPKELPLKKYPEIAFEHGKFEAHEYTNTYIQSGYTISSSTAESDARAPWTVFNQQYSEGNGWRGVGSYSTSDGSFTGTFVDFTNGGQTIATADRGEWLKITLPKKIKLNSFILQPRNSQTAGGQAKSYGRSEFIKKGAIWGSNDGSSWSKVYTINAALPEDTSRETFTIPNSTIAYNNFVLVVTHTQGAEFGAGANGVMTSLGEWELYSYEDDPPVGDTSVDTTFTSTMNTPQTTGANVYVDGSLGETFTNRVAGLLDSNISNTHTTYVSAEKYWELSGNVESNVTIEANTFLSGDKPHTVSVWFNSSNLEANTSNSCILSVGTDEKIDCMNSGFTNTYETVSKLMAGRFRSTTDADFGTSVAITPDGTKIIVGAAFEDNGASNYGAVYIYEYRDGNWDDGVRIGAPKPASGTGDQGFGFSVAINSAGTKIAVGAHYDDTDASDVGAVYIYNYSDGAWIQEQKLHASDKEANDRFGSSLSMNNDGTKFITGAYYEDTGASNAGSAYVFAYNGSSWSQEAKIQASDASTGGDSHFGWRVAMNNNGTKVVVGAPYHDLNASNQATTNAGAAYVFAYDGSSWSQEAKIQASDIATLDLFGACVDINSDGTKIVVGSEEQDTGGSAAGAAYVYTYSSGSWGTEQKIQASDKTGSVEFGTSAAFNTDGTKLIVGALYEDSGTTTDNTNSGAAYVFEYSGSSWNETRKIKAYDHQTGDRFGNSVAMSGDGGRVIIGALYESAQGLNAGAAYIYDRDTVHHVCDKLSGEQKNGKFVKLSSNTWHNLTYAYGGIDRSRVTYLDGRKINEEKVRDTFGEYPALALTESWNCGYEVSASSQYSSAYYAPEAFNGTVTDNGDAWLSANRSHYNGTGTAYTGHEKLAANIPKGEWLKIRMPFRLVVKYVSLCGSSSTTVNPTDWIIYGSNDDANWDELLSATGQTIPSFGASEYNKHYYIGATKAYKYFALVVRKNNGFAGYTQVGELKYFGHRENDMNRLPNSTDVLRHPIIPFNRNKEHVGHFADNIYANRDYRISTTSEFSTRGGTYSLLAAFDNIDDTNNTYWSAGFKNSAAGNLGRYATGSHGAYNEANGDPPTGKSFIPSNATAAQKGEWIKMESKYKLKLNKIELWALSATHTLVPSGVKVWGSDDDSNWTLLKEYVPGGTGGEVPYSNRLGVLTVNSAVAYKYHAMVMTHMRNSPSNYTLMSISQIKFFGTDDDSSPIPIQIGGGNIDRVANFRVYDRFIEEDQALEIWDAQKDEFGRAKSSMTLHKGRIGLGTTEPEGRLAVLDEPHNYEEFPPGPMNNHTNFFDGHGHFCTTASSIYGSNANANQPWGAFSKHTRDTADDSWNCADNAYANDGTVKTYMNGDGTGPYGLAPFLGIYTGEWLKLKLPYKVKLEKYRIEIRGNWYQYAPSDFVIIGSNDDKHWELLDKVVRQEWTKNLSQHNDLLLSHDYKVNTTKYYKYLAIVCSAIAGPGWESGIDQLNILELRYFGYREQGQSVLNDGNLTLTKSLNVPRIGPSLDEDYAPRRDKLVIEYNTSTNPMFENGVRDTSGSELHGVMHSSVHYSPQASAFVFPNGESTGGMESSPQDNLFNTNAKHTFITWIRMDSPAAWETVYGIGSVNVGAYGNNQVNVYIGNDVFRVECRGGSYRDYNYAWTEGRWLFFASTYEGTGGVDGFKIYVASEAGVAMGPVLAGQGTANDHSPTSAITIPSKDQYLAIGVPVHQYASRLETAVLHGAMSSIKLYNEVLTLEEIRRLYEMGRCDEGNNTVNFSKTRVGVGLGDGMARAHFEVRDAAVFSDNIVLGDRGRNFLNVSGVHGGNILVDQGGEYVSGKQFHSAISMYPTKTSGNPWHIGAGSSYRLHFGVNSGIQGYIAHDANGGALNFTGQHRTFIKDVPFSQVSDLEGLIVSSDQNKYIKMAGGIEAGSNAITTNESLPIVSLSNVATDKKCFGVISSSEDPEERTDAFGTFVTPFEKEKGDTRVYINSVGEGAIWVVNTNGSLEAGDYITTSNITGYGQKQADDILHNYSVAKITMDCDFNPSTQPVQQILRSNVTETFYLGDVHNVKTVPHEIITTTVGANDNWSNVYITPSDVTYAEWSNLEANIQNTYTLTYTQSSNVVYDTKYTLTTTNIVEETDSWDQVAIVPPEVTYAEYSNLESNIQSTYNLTFTKTVTDTKTPEEWSALDLDTKSLYNKIYYQSIEQEVDENYPGAVTRTRVTDQVENVLDAHGQIRWEEHPTETEKAYKLRYLTADGTQTDEANAVHIAAFVGCTYHCG